MIILLIKVCIIINLDLEVFLWNSWLFLLLIVEVVLLQIKALITYFIFRLLKHLLGDRVAQRIRLLGHFILVELLFEVCQFVVHIIVLAEEVDLLLLWLLILGSCLLNLGFLGDSHLLDLSLGSALILQVIVAPVGRVVRLRLLNLGLLAPLLLVRVLFGLSFFDWLLWWCSSFHWLCFSWLFRYSANFLFEGYLGFLLHNYAILDLLGDRSCLHLPVINEPLLL